MREKERWEVSASLVSTPLTDIKKLLKAVMASESSGPGSLVPSLESRSTSKSSEEGRGPGNRKPCAFRFVYKASKTPKEKGKS